MSSQLAAQPESVGDLIGRAVRLYRFNIANILQELLLPTVVFAGGRVAIQLAVATHGSGSDLPVGAISLGIAGFLVAVLGLWWLILKQIALTVHLVNFVSSQGEANRRVVKRQGLLLAYFFLGTVAFFVNAGIWLASAVLLAVMYRVTFSDTTGGLIGPLAIVLIVVAGFVIGSLLVSAFMSLCMLAASVEELDFGSIVKAVTTHITSNLMRVTIFGLALSVCLTALMPSLYLPPILVGASEGYRYAVAHGKNMSEIPPYLMVLGHIWESVVNMILFPLFFFSVGLFYRDLMMRERASDVLQKLAMLEGSPT